MHKARLEVWIWCLIYGGLLLLTVGLFVGRALGQPVFDTRWGWPDLVAATGAALVVVGAVLIVVRSKML
jgi:hypothetical protein